MKDGHHPTVDAERIAALLDGKLSPAERAEVLAQIDASPEAFEVYADAIAILRETEHPDQSPAPSPAIEQGAHSRRFGDPRTVGIGIGLALAAAIAFAIVIPTRPSRGRATGLPTPGLLLRSLARLDDSRSIIGQPPPWTEVRGAGDGVSARARAIRIGVRALDLEVLVERGDSAGRRAALEIAALVDGFPGGAPAATAFRSVASGRLTHGDVEAALLTAAGITPGDDIKVGALIEAARIAAAARDRAFFQSVPIALLRAAIGNMDGAPDNARQLLLRIEAAMQTEPPDWLAVQRGLEDLLKLLAE